MVKILAFSGSARSDSFNQRLVATAAETAKKAGAEVTLISLADYPMPLFNQDQEAADGLPQAARAFKQLLLQHQGILLASPEYNSSISPLLKNAIDWASRKDSKSETGLAAYQHKVAAIMAASPGALGGLRGLVVLRMLLGNLGVTVLPNQVAVGNAANAFASDGSLVDSQQADKVAALSNALVRTTEKLHGN